MPRVLVADDNLPSLIFLDHALQSLGYDAVAVADGAAALRAASVSRFDVLLFDAHMPILGGAQAWHRIRAEAGPSHGAFAVATTADDSTDARATLVDAGFVDVLIKPLTVEALGSSLARCAPLVARAVGEPRLLDDRQGLAAGGDAGVLTALRTLLAGELDALPMQIARIAARQDADALRERLHRLDASAGFCGAPALSRAAQILRGALDSPPWPGEAITQFLHTCERVRAALGR